MVNTVIYDGGPLPITISGSGDTDLVNNSWTAYLFRDGDSFVEMPKSSFTLRNGFYEYVIPAATMKTLAKGMYSLRIEVGSDSPIVVANIMSLKKHTRIVVPQQQEE